MMIHLFLDDVRNPPKDGMPYVVARDVATAKTILVQNWDRINSISFDHDLGDNVPSGYDLATWIEEEIVMHKRSNHFTMTVHSANPIGAKRIRSVIENLYQRA